jgi:hypothetical protein
MADCSELADNILKMVMNISTRDDVKNLDDAIKVLQEYFPDIRRDVVVEYMNEAMQTSDRKTDDLTKKLMGIRNEARSDKALNAKIDELTEYLETGKLPPVKGRKEAPEATAMLRSIIADLRTQLNRSEPARRKRLEKSIADLEQRLKTGDILPKQRSPQAESKEIDKLIYKQDMMRMEIQDLLRSMEPLTFWSRSFKYLDFARLIMTTGEFSFALRQGGVYALSHPLKWTGAMAQAFRSFVSTEGLYAVNKGIFNRENAPYYNKSGLVLLREGMSLTQTEEVIMNYWADKFPVIRNFNRAAVGFLNTVRADMFDMGYKTLGATSEMTQNEMEIWANYINVMTGRGNLGKLDAYALAMNRAFFSARYVASRFQMLGGAVKNPLMSVAGQNKRAYRMITREYLRLGMGLLTIWGLGLLMGVDIEEDPRSSDFGKIKIGNRRADFLMGFGQVIRLMAQLTTGTRKTAGGEIVPLREKYVFGYEGRFFTQDPEMRYGAKDVENVLFQFGRSKLSPQFGFMMNLVTGKQMTGEEVTLLNLVTQMAHPMTYGDIYEAAKEEGIPENVALSIMAMLGWGLQTYDSEAKYAGQSTLTRPY